MSSPSSQTDARGVTRSDVVAMLAERGVDDPEQLMASVPEADLDGVLGAIAFWDDQQERKTYRPTPGLLVKKIRDGGMSAYRRPHQRTAPETFGGATGLTPERISYIRGQLLGGPFDRGDAADRFSDLARRLGTPVTALIDTVMGQTWLCTPPHPAVPALWRAPWEYPDDLANARYALHCGGYLHPKRARDAAIVKGPGESQWDFACRFWGWTDPDGFEEGVARAQAIVEQQERERREQRAADEERMRAAQAELQAAAAATNDAPTGEQGALLLETRSAIGGADSEVIYAPANGSEPGVREPAPEVSAPPAPETAIPADDDW